MKAHPTTPPCLVDVEAAARMLDISARSIWRFVEQGHFPKPLRLGRATRWRLSDLEEFIGELAEKR
jgi:prophage regulatory protein